MVRAAARGLVDFSKIRRYEPTWYSRLQLMLDAVESEDLFKLREYEVQLTLLRLQQTDMPPDIRKGVVDQLDALLDRQYAYYRPWQFSPKQLEKREQREAKALTSAWENKYGKMSDPETQARIQRVADAMLAMHAETPRPSALSHSGIFNRDTAQLLSQKPRT